MATLTPHEIEVISKELNTYKVGYQEIYDELLDHIVTAIEQMRQTGDERPVSGLFNNIVNEQFGGRQGIKTLARKQMMAYRNKIHRMVVREQWGSVGLRLVIVTITSVAIASILPENVYITLSLYLMMMLALLFTGIYLIIKMRHIKPVNGRYSLRKSFVIKQTFWPVLFFNLVFMIPNMIQTIWGIHARNFIKVHPVIALFLLGYTLFYAKSCYRVYRKEIEKPSLT